MISPMRPSSCVTIHISRDCRQAQNRREDTHAHAPSLSEAPFLGSPMTGKACLQMFHPPYYIHTWMCFSLVRPVSTVFMLLQELLLCHSSRTAHDPAAFYFVCTYDDDGPLVVILAQMAPSGGRRQGRGVSPRRFPWKTPRRRTYPSRSESSR